MIVRKKTFFSDNLSLCNCTYSRRAINNNNILFLLDDRTLIFLDTQLTRLDSLLGVGLNRKLDNTKVYSIGCALLSSEIMYGHKKKKNVLKNNNIITFY